MLSGKYKCASVFIPFLFFAQLVFPQSQQYLKLTDQNKTPIEFASVKYGSQKLASDAGGFCNISNYAAGKKIAIKRKGFADTNLVLTSEPRPETLTVVLRRQIFFVKNIPVSTGLVNEVNPKQSAFILDYDLDKNYIVQLVGGGVINVLDKNSRLLYSGKCPKDVQGIVKDLVGTLNLVSTKNVFKIETASLPPRFDSLNIAPEIFFQVVKDYDEVIDSVFYLKKKDKNLNVTDFYAITKFNSKPFKTIYGEQRLLSVRSSSGKLNTLTAGIFEKRNIEEKNAVSRQGIRTPEMIRWSRKMTWTSGQLMDRPSVNILKYINDSIRIFAHDIDSILVFDKNRSLIRKVHMDYHHLKCWKKELIVSEEKNRVWALMEIKHDLFLAEINLVSGHLKLPFIKVNSVKTPEKIRIRGNMIFFMAKQADGVGKTVFCQEF